MALVADALVEEKALLAKEWIQSSASQQQQQLSLSSMQKSASKSKEGVVSPERANESVLFAGMNLAQVGSVEVVLLALDMPVSNDNEEDGIPPLSSTLIKSNASRGSSSNYSGKSSVRLGSSDVGLQALDMPMCKSNEMREDGFASLTTTGSPLIKSKCSMSSCNPGKRDDGILPPLTSSCSPLITSKSSKSSSNQGSLPGLVVAPDGVTLVKDRRKCKPRGVLTVGIETSSFSSDGEAALPMPSPSVATVEWMDERWNDELSPHQSHPDELNRSCSTVTSKSVRSPRVALNFDFHKDSTQDLRVRDVSSNIREVVELLPEIVPSIQEWHDLKESVEGRPADLIFANCDVSFRPELAPELPPSGKDCSVSSSSSKQKQHIRSSQLISPHEQMVVPDLDHHHYHDIRQSLQMVLEDDVNGSPPVEISERPCDSGSDIIPHGHSDTRCLSGRSGETHLGIPENPNSEIGSFCPLSVSPRLLETPGNEDASSADVPLGSLTDLACARGLRIVRHKHGEGFEICGSELSQRQRYAEKQLSPEELVAETLYELAAENLRKTRTGARSFNTHVEKNSPMEAASLLSIVKQSVSSEDTSTSSEHATRMVAVPCVPSSRMSGQVSSRPELANVDFAQPLKTIVVSRESDFSQELITLKALIGNLHLDAHDNGVQGLPATLQEKHEEVEGPDELNLTLSEKPQRQRRRLSYGYYTNSKPSILKAQQQRRLSPCGKRVGFGTILAGTAALGIVVISLAMGSCQQCYKNNQYQYYIRPT